MRQMRAVSQSADQDDEPYRIKSERHSLNPPAAPAAAALFLLLLFVRMLLLIRRRPFYSDSVQTDCLRLAGSRENGSGSAAKRRKITARGASGESTRPGPGWRAIRDSDRSAEMIFQLTQAL